MSVNRFEPFLTLHEAIDLLGVSRSTFDRWRKQKRLPVIKIGKEIWIDKNELEQWVRHHSSSRPDAQKPSVPASDLRPSSGRMTVAVGYQSRSAHMWTALLMKELGWFEEELARVCPQASVRWIDAANGPSLLQGLIGGSIQIASLGDYPIMLGFSLSRSLPAFRPVLLAFDGKTAGGRGISLVARKDLVIRCASELAGLPLATVPQSSAGRRLAKWLRSLGYGEERLVHKDIAESAAALRQGEIAGSVMWEPHVTLMEQRGEGKIFFKEGFGEDYLTGIVAEENWARQHPEAAAAYVKAHIRVHHLLRGDVHVASRIISRLSGIPAETAARIIAKVRWDASVYDKDLRTLSRLMPEEAATKEAGAADAPRDAGGTDYSPMSEYFRRAVEALKLPDPGARPVQGDWSDEQHY